MDINKEALKNVLGNTDARLVFWEIMAGCGTFRNAFTNDDMTFYQLGKQSIGQELFAIINEIDNKIFFQMQNEAYERALIQKEREDIKNDRTGDKSN